MKDHTLWFWAKTLIIALALLCFGCGGGGGGDGGNGPVGTFLDSAVKGLEYRTETQAGRTDSQGRFHYIAGETVNFSMGTLSLGEAQAGARLTPIDLVDGAGRCSVTNPTVTNISRFLQSLDVDGDVSNGITISDEIINEVSGRSIDFAQSLADFENDADVQNLFDTLNQLGVFTTSGSRTLVSSTQAQNHLEETLVAGFAGEYEGKFSGDDTGNWRIVIDPTGDVIGRVTDDNNVFQAFLDGVVTSCGTLSLTMIIEFLYRARLGHWRGTIDREGYVQGEWNTDSGGAGSFSGEKTSKYR